MHCTVLENLKKILNEGLIEIIPLLIFQNCALPVFEEPLNNVSAIQRIVYRSDNTVCDI